MRMRPSLLEMSLALSFPPSSTFFSSSPTLFISSTIHTFCIINNPHLSGVQPGLTMVVGPPGTGKTDTAVQIMNVLYHNCPTQRTLLITHSNQALNDLFQKILERDVPSRYLLRLGKSHLALSLFLTICLYHDV